MSVYIYIFLFFLFFFEPMFDEALERSEAERVGAAQEPVWWETFLPVGDPSVSVLCYTC